MPASYTSIELGESKGPLRVGYFRIDASNDSYEHASKLFPIVDRLFLVDEERDIGHDVFIIGKDWLLNLPPAAAKLVIEQGGFPETVIIFQPRDSYSLDVLCARSMEAFMELTPRNLARVFFNVFEEDCLGLERSVPNCDFRRIATGSTGSGLERTTHEPQREWGPLMTRLRTSVPAAMFGIGSKHEDGPWSTFSPYSWKNSPGAEAFFQLKEGGPQF